MIVTRKRIRIILLAFLLIFSMSMPVTAQAATYTQKIKVAKKAKTYKMTVKSGSKIKLKIYSGKKKLSNKKCKFKTSKKSIATVSKSGTITAKKAGKATITIKNGKKRAKFVLIIRRKSASSTSSGTSGGNNGRTASGGNSGNDATAATSGSSDASINADGTVDPTKIVWSAADKLRFQNVPYGYTSSIMTPGWHKILMPVVGYPNGAGIASVKYWNKVGEGKYTYIMNVCEYDGVDYMYDEELEMSRGFLVSWNGFNKRLQAKFPGKTIAPRAGQRIESALRANYKLDVCKKYESATDFVKNEVLKSSFYTYYDDERTDPNVWLFWASEVDSWTRQWNGKTVSMRWQYFLYGDNNPMGYDYGPFETTQCSPGYYSAATAVDSYEAISDERECWLYVPA